MKRIARVIVGLLVFALAVPVGAQVTDDDIDRARQEVNRITNESAELGDQVIAAYGRQAALDAEIAALQDSIEYAEVKMTETQVRLEDLAVELYMGSTSGTSLSMLFSATDQEYPAGLEYLREVNGFDEGVVDQLRSFREELDHQTGRLDEALDEQVALAAELEALASELQEDLVQAQGVYDELVQRQAAEEAERRRQEELRRQREEAEARARAEAEARAANTTNTTQAGGGGSGGGGGSSSPPPVPSGSGACPVAGAVSFSDSWGAPRSGGRAHRGVDMIAARGTPIVAIFSGRIQRFSNSSLGGKSIYFVSDAGDMYYYAHLDDFADVGVGQAVAAGTVIGYNGSTGNAPSYLPHLHFEYHPGGRGAVNPYPLVKGLCG
ncbi:MAG TPA: peptidoglycan DD-metalloendopeptidase family protein [Acidimicrobiia bacterium]|nr:peptidoglycan DD-metalloendopeptidase family protein [Acidimicrobiia bacterium]